VVRRHELTDEQWQVIQPRFWRWARNGTLTTLVRRVRVIAEAIDELDREVAVDSTIVRAHQHAAGAHQPPARTGGGRAAQRTDRTR
jgi:transposase